MYEIQLEREADYAHANLLSLIFAQNKDKKDPHQRKLIKNVIGGKQNIFIYILLAQAKKFLIGQAIN